MKQFPVRGKSVPKTAADRIAEGRRAFSEGGRINRPEPILAGPMLIGIPIMSRDELLNAGPYVLPSERAV
jgi:hypothetical protein